MSNAIQKFVRPSIAVRNFEDSPRYKGGLVWLPSHPTQFTKFPLTWLSYVGYVLAGAVSGGASVNTLMRVD